MKKLILCVGAAAFAIATPALAQPGQGNANKGKGQSAQSHGQAQGKAHSRAQGKKAHGKHVVTMRNGARLYALDARGACPPGLAKKNNGCMPPGQAKKLYNVGQRYNHNYGNAWTYDQIPYHLRSQHSFDRSGRYYYRDGYLYQVNPRTMLVQQVVSALLR
jgi:Ni/Co efflux regulator RcnB